MEQEDINFDKNLALFYFAYRAFSKTSDELVGKYGITKVHRRILFFVHRFPGLTIKELLIVLDISKQALNRPMQELTELGWIEKKSHETDKRSKKIYLTESGLAIDQQISQAQNDKMKLLFKESGDPVGTNWTKVMTLYAKETGIPLIDQI